MPGRTRQPTLPQTTPPMRGKLTGLGMVNTLPPCQMLIQSPKTR